MGRLKSENLVTHGRNEPAPGDGTREECCNCFELLAHDARLGYEENVLTKIRKVLVHQAENFPITHARVDALPKLGPSDGIFGFNNWVA